MGIAEISNASNVPELLLGLDPSGFLFAMILYACTTIFIIGWSYHKGLGTGMLVGGLFSTLLGFGMLIAKLTPMSVLIIPITLFSIGLLMVGFDVGKKDA